MAADWVECLLADACSSIDYGLTASASADVVGPKFLRITDIVSGSIDWSSVPYVDADPSTATKYGLADGDIVLARTGASTGASAYVKVPPRSVFASYLVRLRAKPEFSSRYLSYYLQSDLFWDFIRGVLGDKSAQPNASAATMTKAPLRAPRDPAEQRRIAHILGTLDDKIELNRRMNETLEEMARALFKSWFVDFDPVRAKAEGRDPGLPSHLADLFSDRVVDSELGQIPEGWRAGCFGDFLTQRTRRVGPREVVVLSAVATGRLARSDDHFTKRVYSKDTSKYLLVEEGDFAFNPSRINIGSIGTLQESIVGGVSPVYVVARPGRDYRRFLEFALLLPSTKAWITSLSSGSVRQSLNFADFASIPFAVPPSLVAREFASQWEALRLRIDRAEVESSVLSQLRDLLLPALIAGRLRVFDDDLRTVRSDR